VTGYHVPDGDAAALCEKLSLLLGNPDEHRRMGLCAAEYAQDYAWEKIAAQIVDVYRDLLKSRK
jgi:glycosyltransferase involved in cell wall biosynthesis